MILNCKLMLVGVVVVIATTATTMVRLPIVAGWSMNNYFHSTMKITTTTRTTTTTLLQMGLYDEPLPPRPAPRNVTADKITKYLMDNRKADEEEAIMWLEEEEEEEEKKLAMEKGDEEQPRLLFEFDINGVEKRNLLPSLSRSLKSGIDCYFESTDRKVQNLIRKTDCHVEDAKWALEACKGDVIEAWTRISVARRMLLDEINNYKQDDDIIIKDKKSLLESEIAQLMIENEYEIQKEERLEKEEAERKKQQWNLFGDDDSPISGNQVWLPTKNPSPIDDEPWFTG